MKKPINEENIPIIFAAVCQRLLLVCGAPHVYVHLNGAFFDVFSARAPLHLAMAFVNYYGSFKI